MSDMEKYLRDLAVQITRARDIARETTLPPSYERPEKVLFCGMGGSAISGDILGAFANSRSRMLWNVDRTPYLPKWVDRKTLVILSSYSGNTHEIRKIFPQVLTQKAPVLAMTSGGWLMKEARKRKLPILELPQGYPPRCAIGYLTFAPLFFLARQGWLVVSNGEIDEVLRTARNFPVKQAKLLAKKLFEKSVRLYGGAFMRPVALRWRTQLAENAKTLAAYEALPEMFHHEIEGWRFPAFQIKKTIAIFLSDISQPDWMIRKKNAAAKVIKKYGAKVFEVKAAGEGPLARMFSLVMLGDWVSFELAKLNRIDPASIPAIDMIKKAEK